MGASTNLVLSLVNAQDAKVLKIDGLENFDVLSSSQSTSTSIINNKATYKKEHYYTIMPKKTGEFTIQASMEYKGKTYRTNELKITVRETREDTTGELKDLFIKTNISAEEEISVSYTHLHQSTGSKDEINSLAEDISGLKRDTFKTDRIRRFKQLYQYFLAAGIICIAAAYFLPEGRNAG